MVVVAFLHVGLIVIDRIIYIKQSRQKFTHHNFYYSKVDGSRISEESFLDNSKEGESYTRIYFQVEELNLPLVSKYFLHIIVLIISHFLIFWYLPMEGNYNLNSIHYCKVYDKSNCNDFLFNNHLIIFYLMYTVYYIFSALQIQNGLLDTRKKSLLMRKDNIINSIFFKIYKSIPFLYELKLTIDWTFTHTALDIFKWIKFESIYDLLFITHCEMKQEKSKDIGEKIGVVKKLTVGGIGFSGILLVLLGPLILFSTLNPTNINNNVIGASLYVNHLY